MCGICGCVQRKEQPVSRDRIKKMADTLVHRGPDQEGLHVDGAVGLGFRRLAVIDLHMGDQPMYHADGSAVIVFNGEIYNFRELRADLEARGCRFRTQSDTEVIVYAYGAYGLDFVRHLRGMFALAIWDTVRRRLVLARDRLGKKPLFYYQSDEGLAFASEIKALLQDERVPRRIAPHALDRYCTYRYTPGTDTILEGVKRLPPAHLLVYTPDDGEKQLRRYWLPLGANGKKTTAEDVDRALRKAVQLRMISDVPFGAFLSGGIDSSIVVALMASMSEAPIKTFSIGFEDDAFNELPYARLVAERYRTDHHEYVVKPDVVDVLPKLVWYADEPFGDVSALPTYYVSKMARQEVTVALNGDGGDECFGGYNHYRAVLRTLKYASMPEKLRAYVVESVIEALPAAGALRRIQQMMRDARRPLAAQYARRMILLPAAMRHALYTPDFAERLSEEADQFIAAQFPEASHQSALTRMTLADMSHLLPDDFLVKVDRMSMANSLEARSPFLDHHVVEAAMTLPDTDRMLWHGPGKRLLRRLYGSMIPRPILRRKKTGFGVPVDRWFRGPLQGLCRDILQDPRAQQRGYFRPEAVQALIERQVAGKENLGRVLWTLVMLELWFRRFVDGD